MNSRVISRKARSIKSTQTSQGTAQDMLRDAIRPVFEQLELRRMLSGAAPHTVYVNDNWVVSSGGDQGAPGLDNGDTVDNSEDDNSLSGLTFGMNAFDSIASAESYITANPGAGITTVHVVAGTYSTQTNLTISGLILEGDNVGANPTSGSPRAHAESILNASNGSLVISASNVTVDGLTIEDARSGTGLGISVTTGGDTAHIQNNILTLNETGVQVGSGVSGVTISNNLVSNNNQSGTTRGQGVRVQGSGTIITGNHFTGQNNNATSPGAVTLAGATNTQIGQLSSIATPVAANTFDANAVNVRIEGATTGTTIQNDSFTTVGTQLYVNDLATGEVTANGQDSFDGVDPTAVATTLNQEYAIEDKITDGIDGGTGAGLVRINPQQVYVTQASENANLGAIQRGVNLAVGAVGVTPGDVIHVQAGMFKENVTVNKGVTLLGANAGVAGSSASGVTPTRTAGSETIVMTNGVQGNIFTIASNGVTIDGFDLEGNDPTHDNGSFLTSGDDSDATYGIRAASAFSNLTVQNNVIRDVQIGFRGDSTSAGLVNGNLITSNWFDSIGEFDFGYAVTLRTNFYANVTNNLMTRVQSGVHINAFSGTSANNPTTFLVQGNTIQAYGGGVWDNLEFNGATSLTIDNNTISSLVAPVTPVNALLRSNYDGNTIGILLVSIQDAVGATITNNNISGMGFGVTAYNTTTSNTITLGNTNTITGNTVGVYLTNIVAFNPISRTELGGDPAHVPAGFSGPNNPSGVAKLTLNGLSLSGNTTGVLERGSNSFTTFDVALTAQGGTTISGGTTGLAVDGSQTSINGDTLLNTTFSTVSGQDILLTNGALHGHTIDATSATFEGKTGATMSLSEEYAAEDKITHAVDDSTLGFVRVNAGNVYVTPNSFTAATLTPSIQRGVDAASANDTVNVEAGSYQISGLTISKGLTLKGAFTGVSGTNAGRGTGESVLNGPADQSVGAITLSTTSQVTLDGFEFDGSKILSGEPAGVNLQFLNNVFNLQAMAASFQTNMIFSNPNLITLTNNHFTTTGFNPTNSAVLQVAGDYAGGADTTNKINATGNTFTGIANFATANPGNGQATLQLNLSGVQGNVQNNIFDGVDIGVIIADESGNLTVSGNTFNHVTRGATEISNGSFGAGVLIFTPQFDHGPITISGNTFENSDSGIRTSNAGGTLVGATVNVTGNIFSGNVYNVVNKVAGTLTLAGDNQLDGITLSGATDAQLYSAEDKIVDAVDVSGYGLVRLKAANVYVTPGSFFTQGGTTAADVQRGVAAAVTGDTVNVEDGSYASQVSIVGKDITLQGQSQLNTIIHPTASLASEFTLGSDHEFPIVYVNNSTSTITSLTVEGQDQGNAYADGFIGVAFNNAGGTIDHVTVTGIRNNPFNGVQNGVAIRANNADAAPRTLNVTNNTVSLYQKNGMTLSGSGLTLSVTGNTVTGAGITPAIAQNGIEVTGGATGDISGNTVSGNEYSGTGSGSDWITQTQSTGILMLGAGAGATLSNNIVDGNDIGIAIASRGASLTTNTLGSNSANRYYGILMEDGASTLTGNTIAGGNVGIALYSLNGDAANTSATISGGSSQSGTSILVYQDPASTKHATASIDTVDVHDTTHTGTGILVDKGTTFIQNSNLKGRLVGLQVQNGGLVDAGSTLSPDGNPTGLGNSAGSNNLTGYTGTGGNYAISDLNAVASSQPNVFARNNNWGTGITNENVIEGKIFDHNDDATRTTVIIHPPQNTTTTQPMDVYVDDDWAGVAIGDDADPSSTADGNHFGTDQFSDIQDAIDAVASGGTVHVAAGTYIANSTGNPGGLDITKPLTILGANSGIDASGSRVAETIIEPGASDPSPFDANPQVVVYVQSSNVTIDGVTVEGDNPGLTSTVNHNGANVDAAEGIAAFDGVGNITITNDIVRDTAYTGVDFDNFNDHAVPTSGNTISHNLMSNLGGGGFGYGIGVLIQDNFYADVTHNVMTGVRIGVQTGNFTQANPGSTASISNNQIATSRAGITYNLHYNTASPFTISGNSITAINDTGETKWDGISIFSQQITVSATVSNNTINGTGANGVSNGYDVWNTPTSGVLSISGGSVSGVQTGVLVSDNNANFGAGDNTHIVLSGVSISASQTGVNVFDALGTKTVTATINGGTTITTGGAGIGVNVQGAHASATISGDQIYNNVTGVKVSGGATATIGGATLADGNNFDGGASADNTTDVLLASDAGATTITNNSMAGDTFFINNQSSQNIDATTDTFDQSSNFRIEDRMLHKMDSNDTSAGLTTWVSGNLYVTNPATTDPGGGASTDSDIQHGIDIATAGNTLNVEAGTYPGLINVTKSLTLLGANANVHPTTGNSGEANGSRGAETIIQHGGFYDLNVGADNVTINGFTLSSPSGTRMLGGGGKNLSIVNNIFNAPQVADTNGVIQLDSNVDYTGLKIQYNQFNENTSSLAAAGDAYTVYLGGSTSVFNNINISKNTFDSVVNAIFQGSPALSGAVISQNIFDGTIGGVARTGGATVNIGKAGNLQFTGNLVENINNGTVQLGIINGSVTSNTFSGNNVNSGFQLWGGEFGTAVSTNVDVSGNHFTYNDFTGATGTGGFKLRPGTDSANIDVHDNTFTDAGTGTSAGSYAIINQGASTLDLTAGNNTFNGVVLGGASTPTLSQFYGIADQILDSVDDPAYHYVFLNPGNVYVTPNSFHPSNTTAPSIQRGIDAATSGDTVNVQAGTYGTPTGGAQVVINKDNIDVKATSGAASTFIEGNGAPGGAGNALVFISANHDTFEGFTVDVSGNNQSSGTEQHPIRVSGDNNIVQNNTVIGKGGSQNGLGILVSFIAAPPSPSVNANSSADNNQILNNTVSNFEDADILIGGSGLADGTLVKGNNVSISTAAIYVDRATNTDIAENNVHDTERYGIRLDGTVARPATGTVIERNDIHDNGRNNVFSFTGSGSDVGAGIYLNGVSAIIRNNFIDNNKRVANSNPKAGILITNSSDGLVSSPTISINSFTGNDDAIINATADVTTGQATFFQSIGRTSTATVNAANNWWDSANGPDAPLNTFGGLPKGETILGDNVQIVPWLTDGTDSEPATAGFQHDNATVAGPTAPTISLDTASDTGKSNSDGITNDTTPSFGGTSDAGTTIQLRTTGGVLLGTMHPSGTTWDITSSALADGTYSIIARSINTTGQFTDSAPVQVTIDHTAPVVNTTPATDFSANEGDTINLSGSATDTGGSGIDTTGWGAITAVPNGNTNTQHVDATSGALQSFTANNDGTYTAVFSAIDIAGNFTTKTLIITVNNVAPDTVAIHGATSSDPAPTTGSEGTAISVSGTAHDVGPDDNGNLSYAWTVTKQVGTGPATAFGTPGSGQSYSFTPDDNATYVITLTVSDDHTSTSTTQTVTVSNVAPSAMIVGAPASSPEGTQIDLTSMVSDPSSVDTASLTYAWSVTKQVGAGPATAFGTPGSASTYSFIPDDGPATFVVSLTVTDKDGGTTTTSQTINVTNVQPTVPLAGQGGVTTINEGGTFTLVLGPKNDPGTDKITSYQIDWGDGTAPTLVTGTDLLTTQTTATHVYDDGVVPSARTITVKVRDEDNTSAIVAGTLAINVNDVAPTAELDNFGPYTEGSNGLVFFQNQSDPSSADTTAGFRYFYDFNNDGDFTDPGESGALGTTSASATVPAQYLADNGTVTVHGRIEDKDLQFTDYFTDITVTDVPPSVNAGADATVPASTTFSQLGNFIDPGADAPWQVFVNYNFDPAHPNDGTLLTTIGSTDAKQFTLSHVYNTPGSYDVRVTVIDKDGVRGTDDVTVTVGGAPTFQVSQANPTPSGFTVTFNRSAGFGDVNLYDGFDENTNAESNQVADVTLTGPSGTVKGSLVWNPSTNTVEFIKTGGILAPGHYTFTLRSAADGWHDTSGALLDGGSGAGTNYTGAFDIAAGGRVLSIPDFARGPDGSHAINLPNTGTLGIPVSISDGSNVRSIDFDITYDPTLLHIENVTKETGLPADWNVAFHNVVNPDGTDTLFISASGTGSNLASGFQNVVKIVADVPDGAAYLSAQALQLSDVVVKNNSATVLPTVGDIAVQKAVYLGEVDGDGAYDGPEPGLIANVAVHTDTGFHAMWDVDPVIVADIDGSGTVDGIDRSFVAQKDVDLPRPEIPDNPGLVSLAFGGIDPDFSTSSGSVTGPHDGPDIIPLNVANATNLSSFNIVVNYDASRLTAAQADVALGDLIPESAQANWSITVNDSTPGVLKLNFSADSDHAISGAGEFGNITFHPTPTATTATTPVDLSGPDKVNANTFTYNDGTILIDADGPALPSESFNYTPPVPGQMSVDFGFGENVGPSISNGDLHLTNLNTNTVVNGTDISVVYGPGNTAFFSFPNFNHGILPDGYYQATINSGDVTDHLNNPMTANASFQFFFLDGDADHDSFINIQDFNILASNFGQSGATYQQGDFNFDGVVNLLDLNVIATKYGEHLLPPSAGPIAASASSVGVMGTVPVGASPSANAAATPANSSTSLFSTSPISLGGDKKDGSTLSQDVLGS